MDDRTADIWTLEIRADWKPSPENKAALPPPIRVYVKQLEAKVAELERVAQSCLHARLQASRGRLGSGSFVESVVAP